jgi:Xaa-Pro dipeptidase
MSAVETRRKKLYEWMAEEGIALLMFEDTEGRRDPTVRWLSGQPSDALLFLGMDGRSLLIPWDVNMAGLYADVDVVVPYTDFQCQSLWAVRAAAEILKTPPGSRVEIPSVTPYPFFLQYVEALSDFDVICRNKGGQEYASTLRAIKDEEEIDLYRKVSAITNELIVLLEENVRSGTLKTEGDVALFIEAEARRRGCEGTGFETLAAGPRRSFGIHAFPAYTQREFATPGLSILDFGLKFAGYTSDVTLTFARGPLSKAQDRMLSLIERAYRLALAMVEEGVPAKTLALAVDTFFEGSKRSMPHGLGHGIGLEAHEVPRLNNRADNDWILRRGMIFTLEPGLYDPVEGGCRLENDVLLTDKGPEVLTASHIIQLP